MDGERVTTIEGFSSSREFSIISEAFSEAGAVQCGFCTPGFIMAAAALLKKTPSPDDSEIKTALSGNLCRCTGYTMIIDAVKIAASKLSQRVTPMSEKNGYKQYTAADLSPVSYAGAMKLLREGFRPVAGGTDLVVRNHALKKASGRTAELPPLFSTRKIVGNSDITAAGGVLNIGAAVTLAEIIENPLCPPVLHDSLLSVASPGIRNIATTCRQYLQCKALRRIRFRHFTAWMP